MADIFLSYKREDREKVRPLVEALQAQGWSVWWDTRIGVGETWDRVIETELAAAKCVVVVWSKLSVDSRWVRSEAHEGLERECLIPVIIERATLPIAFKLIQTTDLTHWRGDAADLAFADISAGVRRTVGQGNPQGSAAEVGQARPFPGHRNQSGQPQSGRAHFEMRDPDIDIVDCTKDIETDPKNPWAYYGRGYAYARKMDYNRARADYRMALQIDPEFEPALEVLRILGATP